jgi:hypothetical protein
MKIELRPGERVSVVFEGTDGEIVVRFGEDALEVVADMPDTTGREGVIYSEEWHNDDAVQKPCASDVLYDILALVIDKIEGLFQPEDLDKLQPAERLQLQTWAGAVHLSASDNDDVVVPPCPADLLVRLGVPEDDFYVSQARGRVGAIPNIAPQSAVGSADSTSEF